MKIALIPLDERPVNTRYPQMIADIAGVSLVLPPISMLSHLREPADHHNLASWLHEAAQDADELLISIETYVHGGLIQSRISEDPVEQLAGRLGLLRRLRQDRPGVRLSAFNVITRISNADNNIEEPYYWADQGVALYRLSQYLDRQLQGQAVQQEIDDLRAAIVPADEADFLRRRLRNHSLNMIMIHALADGVFDSLIISSDDTSEYGLGSREKRWLADWVGLLWLHEPRLLMYPGADEIGCTLLMRSVLRGRQAPRIAVQYSLPDDAEVIAPYEDGPIRVTIERQIRAVGGIQTNNIEEADLILAVNSPSRIRREYDWERADEERAARLAPLTAFVAQTEAWLSQGRRVIVGDVAYPNGSDPLLVELLCTRRLVKRLDAYGAWNTAGNTLGTALAQGIAAWLAQTPAQQEANEAFLVHRFIEDWAYQHHERDAIRDWLEQETGQRDITPEDPERMAEARSRIEARLHDRLLTLPELGLRWRIVPGSLRFPWQRTFEIDFDLERR